MRLLLLNVTMEHHFLFEVTVIKSNEHGKTFFGNFTSITVQISTLQDILVDLGHAVDLIPIVSDYIYNLVTRILYTVQRDCVVHLGAAHSTDVDYDHLVSVVVEITIQHSARYTKQSSFSGGSVNYLISQKCETHLGMFFILYCCKF